MTNDRFINRESDESNDENQSDSEANQKAELPQENENRHTANELKAERNLTKTLSGLRASLEKGRILFDLGRKRFDEDWIVQDAAVNLVIQLAEESKRLPKSFRDERPEIAWRSVIGMRNIVTHEYETIDLAIVWNAIQHEFPRIQKSVFGDGP